MNPKLRFTLLAVVSATMTSPLALATGELVGVAPQSEQPVFVTITERGEVVLAGKATSLERVLTYFNALGRDSGSSMRRVLLQAERAEGAGIAWVFGALAKAGLQHVQFASKSVAPIVPRELRQFAGQPQLTRLSLMICRKVEADRPLQAVETFLWAARAQDEVALTAVTDFSVERLGIVPAGVPDASARDAARLRKKAEDRIGSSVAVQYYDAKQSGGRVDVHLLFESADGMTRFFQLTVRLGDDQRWRLVGYFDAGLAMLGESETD